jgi:hypothetical protein
MLSIAIEQTRFDTFPADTLMVVSKDHIETKLSATASVKPGKGKPPSLPPARPQSFQW